MKAVAREYWLQGCNIVLLKGKEPLHKWQKWQAERQSEGDFEALPWSEADGFAIVCGQQLHNKFYVGAIDLDVKNLPPDVVEKGRQALKHLPVTQIEETPSGGQHWIYLTETKTRSNSGYHNSHALEILGEGKLCIMAPSLGYKRLNDNTPTEVEDLEALLYSALEKAGIKAEKPVEVWRNENLYLYLLTDAEKTIKRDIPTKVSVFFTGLSTYLREPINLFLKGESGIGKTYVTVEMLRYFPDNDVWYLGGLSPKALVHEYGTLVNKNGEPINLEDKPIKPKRKDYENVEEYQEALREYREDFKAFNHELRDSYTLINMRHKILVFLEAPEQETYRILYPILSHDKDRIEYRFTDKSIKGLVTRKVVIEGAPATIFLTVDRTFMEELTTRSFTVTPESSKQKINEAQKLINLKASFPWFYSEETEETKILKALVENIKRHFAGNRTDVVVPFANLYEVFPKKIIRDMRDFQHFIQLLEAFTALHFLQRPFIKCNGKRFIVSTVEDVERAFQVLNEIFETTRTGTERKILNFYHEIIKTKNEWHLSEATTKYNELHPEKKLSSDSVALMLKRLSEIGYINIEKDGADRRVNVYKPLIMEEEKGEIHRIIENREILNAKLENGFKEWLENYPKNSQFYYYKNFSEDKWGEQEISVEEASKLILNSEKISLTSNEDFFGYFSNENLKLETENKLENQRESGFRENSANLTDGSEKPMLTNENFGKVWNGFVEACKARGVAHLTEIVCLSGLPVETVQQVLKKMVEEGKLYSPYLEWYKKC